jgi:hypothetical protein
MGTPCFLLRMSKYFKLEYAPPLFIQHSIIEADPKKKRSLYFNMVNMVGHLLSCTCPSIQNFEAHRVYL